MNPSRKTVLRAAFAALASALFLIVPYTSAALAQTSGLDGPHQQKLLSLLGKSGFASTFDKNLAALLGVSHKGQHVPTRKVQFYSANNTVLYAFSRIDAGGSGYFFFFDPEKDNPSSAAIAFRTDPNFKLVGMGIEWVGGKATRLSPRRSAELFTEQMQDWAKLIDAN